MRYRLRGATLGALSLMAMVYSVTSRATPNEEKLSCVASHTLAQELLRSGDAIGARAELNECLKAGCPRLVREDCKRISDELAKTRATLIVEAKTATVAATAIRVTVDGSTTQTGAGEHRFDVSVGQHSVRVDSVDGTQTAREFQIDARTGENRLSVLLDVAPAACGSEGAALCTAGAKCAKASECEPSLDCRDGECKKRAPLDISRSSPPSPQLAPTPATTTKSPAPPTSLVPGFVFLGIGAVGLGSFAGFALDGKSSESALGRCAPRCDTDAVDGMYRSYAIADVSLVIGLLSTALGTYLTVRHFGGTASTAGAHTFRF